MDNIYSKDLKDNPNCATCQRTSMFVPVRIAIAIDDQTVDNPFGPPDYLIKSLPQLPNGLTYILRRLSEGYVYAYSDSWKFDHYNDVDFHVYQVNETGFITAVDKDEINEFKPSTYQCFQSEKTTKEINITNALGLDLFVNIEENSKINMMFARHQLSPKTLENIKKEKNNRDIIMPLIDIKKGSNNFLNIKEWDILENVENLKDSSKLVAWEKDFVNKFSKIKYSHPHYANNPIYLQAYQRDEEGKVIFDKDDNPIPIKGTEELYDIIKEDRLIVLNDPIGMIEDLLNIIEYKKNLFTSDLDKKKFQAMTNILTLKANVQGKIFTEELSDIKTQYDRKVISEEMGRLSSLEQEGYEVNRQITIQYENRYYDYTLKEIENLNKNVKKEFEDAWYKNGLFSKSFSSYYKEEEMIQWLELLNMQNENYVNNNLLPLIEKYLSFLKSDILFKYMEYSFDHETKFSATNFLEICSRIIGESDTFKIVSEYYSKLLDESDFSNGKNYLFRLMTYDSKNIQSKVIAASGTLNTYQMTGVAFATSQLIDESGLKILNGANTQLNHLSERLNSLNNLLSEQIGGCASRVINGQAKRTFNKTVAMKSLETFSDKLLIGSEYEGTLKQVTQKIIKDFNIDYSELVSKNNQSKRNAKKALNLSYIANIQNLIQGIFISNTDFYKYGEKNVRIKVVLFKDRSGSLITGDDVVRNTQGEIIKAQDDINKGEATKKAVYARTGTGFGFGVFAFNLQFVTLLGAIEKTTGSAQTQFELAAALSATVGNIADVFSRKLDAKIKLIGSDARSKRLLEVQQRIMRYGLYGAALILSGIEVYKGINASKHNNYVLAFSYLGNASMIFWSTSLFVRGANYLRLGLTGGWWGLITLPILYGISQWIEFQKNNVMKEYIAKSLWGVESAGWSLGGDEQAFKNSVGS